MACGEMPAIYNISGDVGDGSWAAVARAAQKTRRHAEDKQTDCSRLDSPTRRPTVLSTQVLTDDSQIQTPDSRL